MPPYADFHYFALLLYVVVVTVLLGLFGRANALWVVIASIAGLLLHLGTDTVTPYSDWQIPQIWAAL
ncbi:MAG: hypothetical protein JWL90_3634, partial [Chthoniobacteraceae bacterium]|nr:hypothetical protein [Chthoniobacteraceae bacterium]